MFLSEFLGVTGLPVGHIGVTSFGIVDDMGPQHGDLCHTLFRCFNFGR